jgi:hypothetical protein
MCSVFFLKMLEATKQVFTESSLQKGKEKKDGPNAGSSHARWGPRWGLSEDFPGQALPLQ